jgi:hypothetical protein
MPIITYIGDVCIDRIIDHNQPDATGAPAITEQWGSPGLHIMKHIYSRNTMRQAQLSLFATHGEDLYPHIKNHNFALANSAAPDVRTLVYENTILGNDRTQRCWHVERATAPLVTERLKQRLAITDILVVAPLTPNFRPEYLKQLTTLVNPKSLKLLLPQGFLRNINQQSGIVTERFFEEAEAVLPLFDATVISDEDCADALTVSREWAGYAPKNSLIVTQNEAGATVVSSKGLLHIPTQPIVPKDMIDPPVGCGDVFSIEYAITRHAGSSEPEAIRSGHNAVRRKLLADESKSVLQYDQLQVEREATS